MNIDKNSAVTINYRLTDNNGQLIDESSDNSFCYLHGHDNIVLGLENALDNKQEGDTFSIQVSPKDGYGERDESRVETVSRDMFPSDEEIQPGMEFHAEGTNKELVTISILEVNEDTVKIDANDSLAGVTLNFDIEVISVREADETEISHGHIHSDESCGHDH